MENKKFKIKLILNIMIGIIATTLGIGTIVYAAEFGSELIGVTDTVSAISTGTTIVLKKDSNSGSIATSDLLDIINSKFNSSTTGSTAESYMSGKGGFLDQYASLYCVKHNKGMSSAGSPIMQTKHRSTFNLNNYISFDRYSSSPTFESTGESTSNAWEFWDYFDDGVSESLTKNASNFNAIEWWSGDLKNLDNYYGVSNPSNNAIAYTFVYTDKEAGEHYANTDAQVAVWNVTGDAPKYISDRYKAGKAVDELENQITSHGETPEVTVKTSENPGTVYLESEDTYRVGPFHMSDYAYVYSEYVKQYSGSGLTFSGLVGGIDGGSVTLVDDDGNETVLDFDSSGAEVVYEDFYGNATYKGNHYRYNSANYTSLVPESEIIYPFPNAVFYIDIPRSESDDATTLKSITFNYRKTTTSGTGSVIITRYALTTWEQIETETTGCTRYYCSNKVSIHGHDSRSYGGEGTCRYCYNETTRSCSVHGSHTVHHYTTHTTIYKCTHGHIDCNKGYWKGTTTIGYGQPLLNIEEATVEVTDTPYISTLNIRLTTKIVIKKYVKEVKHATNGEITFGDSATATGDMASSQTPAERKDMTDSEKEDDPVYAEYGDIITYRIDLINEQNYDVKVQLKDILPDEIELISRDFEDYDWIKVPKLGETQLEMVIMTVANDDDVYVNEVKLVTKNNDLIKDSDENVDFVRTTDSYKGPVVNISEIDSPEDIESKEYYKINDYNLDIDKYITDYDYAKMTENNNNKLTNETYDVQSLNDEERLDQTIEKKQNYPVPVENGEQITYSIRLTNNSEKTGNNKVATKIRPTEIIDILDDGLEYVESSAKIYDKDGNVQFTLGSGDFSITEDESVSNKFYIRLNDKQGEEYLIVEPEGYIIYQVTVKVIESNMYLPIMENKVNISILSNINNGTDTSSIAIKCSTCNGTGKTEKYESCDSCNGSGLIYTTEKCTICDGTGSVGDAQQICSTCSGKGYVEENCTHDENNTIRVYECKTCSETYFCLEGESGPTVCNNYSTDEIYNTEFYEICTICGELKGECSHYVDICTGDGTHTHAETEVAEGENCSYVYSCSEYHSYTGSSIWYTYKCPNCGVEVSDQRYSNDYYCSTCHSYMIFEYCYCYYCNTEYDEVVTECTKTYECTNTNYTEYCYDNDGSKHLPSTCDHYKFQCSKCGKLYDEKPEKCEECVEYTYGYCNSTEFDMTCLTCSSNGGKIKTQCSTCSGTGTTSSTDHTCSSCNGAGNITTVSVCSKCMGSGKMKVESNCTTCGGNGKTVDVEDGDRIVRTADASINRNLARNEDDDGDGTNEQSSDYVRMKDLVISGFVWLDYNRDGYMNEEDYTLLTDEERAYYNIASGTAGKENVTVRLYSVINGVETLVRTTKTDSRGRYTFSNYYNESSYTLDWYNDYKNSSWQDYNSTNISTRPYSRNSKNYISATDQRIDKATNKDEYGNYTSSSTYIDYYIEFEYDGTIYKSTEYYSGMTNLNNDSSSADYGKGNTNYTIDSNAYEFTDVRNNFNEDYEYISYDIAYSADNNLEVSTQKSQTVNAETGEVTTSNIADNSYSSATLNFDKTDHTSQLMENSDRIMTARSFIKDTNCSESIDNTNLLWLFKHSTTTNSETPSTEYLKYINLGLELREDVDIALTKDVYKVKTTIDGEEMEYTFNQNNGLNGEMGTYDYSSGDGTSTVTTYLNDYIISAPYGLDLYEADYKARVEQYMSDAVKQYKGLNGESELNVEVTYRITIANKAINDDETINKASTQDTDVKVKISEILDLYDENFMKVNFDSNGQMSSTGNTVTVKTKDDDGYLIDTEITIAEAWYFREIEDGETVASENRYRLDENSTLPLTYNNTNGRTVDSNGVVTNKPVYIQDDEGDYVKVSLEIREKSYRDGLGQYSYKENDNDFTGDGYNTLYITGMDDVLIGEGEDLDIYVKYVLDKEASEVEITNSDFDETKTSALTVTKTESEETAEITSSSSYSTTLERSLKIAERVKGVVTNKGGNGRGLEGIAQVNAYSVWYEENNTLKAAGLVDRDANAGNIGNSNTTLVNDLNGVTDSSKRKDILSAFKNNKTCDESADEVSLYEDMTYKTGIELTADGTENTKDKVNERWASKKVKIITEESKMIRELSGMVWDDSRTTTSGSSDELQYIGDGIYNSNVTKTNDAKTNDNVTENYDNDTLLEFLKTKKNKNQIDEDQDINVRNVKAELVEIVEIPQYDNSGNYVESHYYEQILTDVTWEQVQHIRTDDSGEYMLTGFIPGNYVVRFTYGDTVTSDDLSNHETYLMNKDGEYVNEEGNVVSEANKVTKSTVDTVTEDMQLFNGQDYKSTQYAYEMSDYNTKDGDAANLATIPDSTAGTIDDYATNSVDNEDNTDMVLAALERPDLSDARDDEIKRLEANNYSEVMINEKAEILKGLANGTELTTTTLSAKNADYDALEVNYYKTDSSTGNSEEQLLELTENTNMYADTVEFLVKAEKLTYEQTTSQTNIYHNYITDKDSKIYYDELETIEYSVVSQREFKIQNIDFGIEYRPETDISLTKEIEDIKIVTSSDTILVDLKVLTGVKNDQTIYHYIDTENSIGSDLVKFITNEYTGNALLNNLIVSEENTQGLLSIDIEPEILQGSSVIVQYKFTATNNSEIDRIATTLNNIRYYANDATQTLIERYEEREDGRATDITDESLEAEINQGEYTANNAARNMVYADVYALDANGDEYRNRAKTLVITDEIETTRDVSVDIDGTNGYYGKYVGYSYYTGVTDATLDSNDYTIRNDTSNEASDENIDVDMIAELKFDKIIDYIDTSLEFGQLLQTSSVEEVVSGTSNAISSVVDSSYVGNQYWSNNSTQTVEANSKYIHKLTLLDEEDQQKSMEEVLTDLNGIQYKSLVVTTADRNSDSDTTVKNLGFSKFLKTSLIENQDSDESEATISLQVSKTVASETDSEDMQYENIAEVIQFTILTGRRTNFDTTIGNADIFEVKKQTGEKYEKYGSIEYVTAALESDTSSTETISLIPSTGLSSTRNAIVEAVFTTKTILQVVIIAFAVIIIGIFVTKFTIKKVSKRRYR